MNKAQFIKYFHQQLNTKRGLDSVFLDLSISDSKYFVNSIIKFIELHYVSNNKLIFKNFGVFYNRFFNSSIGLDPTTLSPIKLTERYIPSFKLSKNSSSDDNNILSKKKIDEFYIQFYENSNFYAVSVPMLIKIFIQSLKNALIEHKKITFSNFCSFEIVHKNERMGRNPKTMEPKIISARDVIRFVPARTLRYRVRKRK